MPIGDIVPELILLVGAVCVLLYTLFTSERVQWIAAPIALIIVLAAGIAAASMLGGVQRLTFSSTYAVDAAAVWGKLVVLVVAALTFGLSIEWFRSDPRHGEYYTLLLFSTLGAVILAGAADLMELTLGVLLSSATGYALAAYHRRSRESSEAAIKYFLLGALANGVMLYGIVLLFGLAASTTYPGLLEELAGAHVLPLAVGGGLLIVGLAFWMPDVADGAPAPAAAFLTAAPKVGALIALARIVLLLPEGTISWRPLIAVLAAVTMTVGNLAALWQENVRRLLGWSAVSQTGYGLMGVVALGRSDLALPALLYFLAAYALANLAAFGVVVELRGLRARLGYDGLARVRPALTAALAVSFLSFIGIPPLAGFAAKVTLFGASIEAGYTWLAIVAVANTVVSLGYYVRVLGPAYFGSSTEPAPSLGRWAAIAVVAATAGVILLGLLTDAVLDPLVGARVLPG
jgi:NADH-quinone oxidoreductase subunit N